MDNTESFADEEGSELPFDEWDTIAELDDESSSQYEGAFDPKIGTSGDDIPFENWDSPAESGSQSRESSWPTRRGVLKFGSVVFGSLAVGPLLDVGARNETAGTTQGSGRARFGYGGRPVDDDSVSTAGDDTAVETVGTTTKHDQQTQGLTDETQSTLAEDTESPGAVAVPTDATTASEAPVRTPDTIETTTAPVLTPIETTDDGVTSSESSTGGFVGGGNSREGGSSSGGSTTAPTSATPQASKATTPTTTTQTDTAVRGSESAPGRALGKQGYGRYGYGGVTTQ